MGNENSRIAEETQMPPAEVAWLQERYAVLTQRSLTSRDTALLTEALFVAKFPESQHGLARLLFDAMDVEGKGVVDFRRFCVAVSVLSSGSFEQKVSFAYRLYDRGGKGYIERGDLTDVVSAFRRSCERLAESLEGESEASASAASAPIARVDSASELRRKDSLVDTMLSHMDSTGTGRVSEAEFAAFCRHHPAVVDQVQQAYLALRRAAMFDWSSPSRKPSAADCNVM